MFFKKQIKSEIKRPYIFYHINLPEINFEYFINKIEEGINLENNKSLITNVKGEMTDWRFFMNDVNFYKMIWPIFDIMDQETESEYRLQAAWGIKNSLGNYTSKHDHDPGAFSGVFYLNSHSQILEFPEINQKIAPEKGDLIIFSSFLKHFTKRNLQENPKYALSFNVDYLRKF